LSAILTLLLETAVWYSIAVLQKRYGPVDFGRGIGVTSQSLNKEFAMATLRDLIKDRKVHSINAGNTVLEAARFMMEHNIGALPVLRDGELAGIFSERDIMNRVVAVGRTPGTTAVSEVMTPNPRAVPVDETVEECLFIMREFGFRHLPIVDGRELKGLVSLRDILMRRAAEIESEARRAVS
jgi:CBS domain-containing protein